ncbi:transporter substrate-binding domain-containing protein [Oxalobacteraceae bacterium R-40]|uniref:Transporter substrate-binding domain-containing protein n=1 Tax=Keguizhuia sedimenti TaxID=3064264 RepID=A0ABU1BQA3_9BURK|nr:transporter substrate-binding domain-containing protein [Oxalobacteraceae bacterium R-40]
MPFPRSSIRAVIAAAGLFSTAALAFAAGYAERGNPLRLGMAHVPPPYQAGTKFRTPEAIDLTLAENAAKTAQASLKTVRTDSTKGRELLAAGKLDALITSLSPSGKLDRGDLAIRTGYAARPMAIMRTDTTIKTADQLRGRKVCVSEGGPYVGMLASKYGALETVAKAPADSLLAVRTGACDAAVHDSAILEELIKLPEWKKFSASLYLGPAVEQSIVVRRDDTRTLNAVKTAANEWQRSGFINEEIKRMVRHIAFEVYLDQNVPDCH